MSLRANLASKLKSFPFARTLHVPVTPPSVHTRLESRFSNSRFLSAFNAHCQWQTSGPSEAARLGGAPWRPHLRAPTGRGPLDE